MRAQWVCSRERRIALHKQSSRWSVLEVSLDMYTECTPLQQTQKSTPDCHYDKCHHRCRHIMPSKKGHKHKEGWRAVSLNAPARSRNRGPWKLYMNQYKLHRMKWVLNAQKEGWKTNWLLSCIFKLLWKCSWKPHPYNNWQMCYLFVGPTVLQVQIRLT